MGSPDHLQAEIALQPLANHRVPSLETIHGPLTILLDERMPPDRFWFGWSPSRETVTR